MFLFSQERQWAIGNKSSPTVSKCMFYLHHLYVLVPLQKQVGPSINLSKDPSDIWVSHWFSKGLVWLTEDHIVLEIWFLLCNNTIINPLSESWIPNIFWTFQGLLWKMGEKTKINYPHILGVVYEFSKILMLMCARCRWVL